MRLGGSNIIALVLSERQIICAQLTGGGADRVLKRIARFDNGNAAILEQPELTGRLLREFLDAQGLNGSKTIIGVPAQWVIAQERDVPPVSPAEALAILQVHAERLSMSDNGSLVVDSACDIRAGAARVLLVGMLQSQLKKIEKFAEAARLNPVAVCPTALAISAALGVDHSLVHLACDGAELVQWQGGSPRLLRPIGSGHDIGTIAVEVKRILTMRGAGSGNLLVCDAGGTSNGAATELTDHAGLNARIFQMPARMGARIDPAAVNGSSGEIGSLAQMPAAVLALAGQDRRRLPVNLIHSRLTVVPPRRFGQTAWLAAAAGAAIVVGAILLMLTAQSREAEEAMLEKQLTDLKPAVAQAQAVIDRVGYGRTYFEKRPPYLDCVRELSLAFNYDEPIWVSGLTLRATREGTLQGKSTDQRLILALRDRLMGNKKFAQVQLLDLREAGGRAGEISYSLSFTFNAGAE